MNNRTIKSVIYAIFALSALCFTLAATAQVRPDEANPYGGIYYGDIVNPRTYGRMVLPRSETSNLDTLTHLIEGTIVFDSLQNRIEYVDTNNVWVGLAAGGNNLDEAYDKGGAGAGREIIADSGAVWVSGEDGFIVTGTYGVGDTSQFVGSGTGMFFNPKKAAFRAGYVDGTQWNDANIGDYSFAIGNGTIASGVYSSSFGFDSYATGDFSTAIGESSLASGESSVSIGSSSVASGNYSTTTGSGTTAKSYSEIAVGVNNTDYTPTSTSAWEATDRLFVIGNGQSDVARADALIIQKNGNLTMPTTTGAFSPPILTTTQRNALTPTAGMLIYNSTDSKHQGYDGTTWNNLY